MIKCYQDLERYLSDQQCGLAGIQLATRRIYLIKAEREWLTEFAEKYANKK